MVVSCLFYDLHLFNSIGNSKTFCIAFNIFLRSPKNKNARSYGFEGFIHYLLSPQCHAIYMSFSNKRSTCNNLFLHFLSFCNHKEWKKKKKKLFLLIVKEKKKGIRIKESVNSEFIMSFLHDWVRRGRVAIWNYICFIMCSMHWKLWEQELFNPHSPVQRTTIPTCGLL